MRGTGQNWIEVRPRIRPCRRPEPDDVLGSVAWADRYGGMLQSDRNCLMLFVQLRIAVRLCVQAGGLDNKKVTFGVLSTEKHLLLVNKTMFMKEIARDLLPGLRERLFGERLLFCWVPARQAKQLY
ncbi:MAG UNVERIFIED_CONTAM: hypothetical protein LVR29_14945 [Microcystis novacekii LVE1205-3]